MSKKTTNQKTEKQTEVKQPVVLSDDELEKVRGGRIEAKDDSAKVGQTTFASGSPQPIAGSVIPGGSVISNAIRGSLG